MNKYNTIGVASLHESIPWVLEDGENQLSDFYRQTLNLLYERLCILRDDLEILDKQIAGVGKENIACRRLTQLESVVQISSILLFATLGMGEAFKNGREFSAYLGLTPKQYSSGGKTNMIGISRRIANKRLRAVLIQGARAYVHRIKEPKIMKDQWLLALIQRAGYGRAAVALANKKEALSNIS